MGRLEDPAAGARRPCLDQRFFFTKRRLRVPMCPFAQGMEVGIYVTWFSESLTAACRAKKALRWKGKDQKQDKAGGEKRSSSVGVVHFASPISDVLQSLHRFNVLRILQILVHVLTYICLLNTYDCVLWARGAQLARRTLNSIRLLRKASGRSLDFAGGCRRV